ncbi:hypothetical protein HaLaN_16227 [Haematococcus lacustris]|uniref:Uncharacterized protein n=1 Tax=Haematococcus lacustris TaxID=44745 RepID=A0A699Z130_HAELA|nr:hypothetical protein HaLaN_12608 [Haematococcus lacustris]GFH19299.1 hypothetical protein HaLaN_16227 [Haematococcus lacustris]
MSRLCTAKVAWPSGSGGPPGVALGLKKDHLHPSVHLQLSGRHAGLGAAHMSRCDAPVLSSPIPQQAAHEHRVKKQRAEWRRRRGVQQGHPVCATGCAIL